MGSSTGYLLGKVQLDGAIRSEVLANLVTTLLQRYQVPETGKKQLKFHDGIKYTVDCSERGLKLTAPGFRSRDEGFESDSESLRSIKLQESPTTGELDLIELMEELDMSKVKDDHGSPPQLLSLSSVASTDNASISSVSNIQSFLDDSNSSSGNGSDSDEFSSPTSSGERSPPSWETLPNLSSFHSYPIQDVLFCHADSLHPSTLVWVVKHLSKMVALITSFRSRSEAEELFQKYREVRLKVKPVKHKMNTSQTGPIVGKLALPPAPGSAPPPPPPRTCSVLSSTLTNSENQRYLSLPSIQPTEVLPETNSKVQVFTGSDSQSAVVDVILHPRNTHLGGLKFNEFSTDPPPKSLGTIPRNFNTLAFQRHYFSVPTINSKEGRVETEADNNVIDNRSRVVESTNHLLGSTNHLLESPNQIPGSTNYLPASTNYLPASTSHLPDSDSEDDSDDESQITSIRAPFRPQRRLQFSSTPGTTGKIKVGGKPVLLVPLKTESVSTPRSSYPKESYMYQVMGRTSSTFAPYQRSLNFVPSHAMSNVSGGTEYLTWANSHGRQLLVPFSAWAEISELRKTNHHQQQGPSAPTSIPINGHRPVPITPKSLRRGISKTSTLSHLTGKGTAKILLRDSGAYPPGVWANLSQRVKQNFRENLMPKLNGMWTQPGDNTGNKVKKKVNKKVTFNAWATVQMV